ncbi:SDR family NAD(P)-dependent oxidoreductase [Sorangium sp. So ce302]|uniref:SDR family oxidoreductase n=1 Tax=Sorangium sp. So ce302 TaxID=3133297 RepID=UPI003F5D8156
MRDAIEDTAARGGRLDLLINNAGIGIAGEAHEIPLPHWNRILDVNVRGVLHGITAGYPITVRQKSGHILNVGLRLEPGLGDGRPEGRGGPGAHGTEPRARAELHRRRAHRRGTRASVGVPRRELRRAPRHRRERPRRAENFHREAGRKKKMKFSLLSSLPPRLPASL